jgi:hypothetical protein
MHGLRWAGTLFALSGGVFTPIGLAMAASEKQGAAKLGEPMFVQICDTHVGFNKEANPDVSGTLTPSRESTTPPMRPSRNTSTDSARRPVVVAQIWFFERTAIAA